MGLGAFFSLPCFIGLMISKNLALTITLYFFLGLCNEAKIGVNWVYLLEFTPTRYQAYIGTLLNISDGLTLLYVSVYFRYISKYWLYYEIFAICNSTIGSFSKLLMTNRIGYCNTSFYSRKPVKKTKVGH